MKTDGLEIYEKTVVEKSVEIVLTIIVWTTYMLSIKSK